MIGNILLFLVIWLPTWAVLMIVYFGVLAAVDHLLAALRRYRRVQQYRRAAAVELASIDAEAVASIERINSAFAMAQRLIREYADVEHRGRES